ncbi:ABC transporter permease [Aliikangiella marina]|uniref:ABC transporter permease n=1 Tax=Aliikangiella marina TaxID=1712262 RepID=A0A545T9P2_9GAMM|nr:ABC transporter permease [Aliikangiella marina]TQV73940.1 ABC transporter permease [Aliikangiella marina]
MSETIQTISLTNLAIAFIPVVIVIGILVKWSLDAKNAVYAVSRMLGQLLLVGYVLAFIFDSDSGWLIFGILVVMVFASSWIALGVIKTDRMAFFGYSLMAILLGGGLVLIVITQGVVKLDPWYLPRYMIPLAGMIFANAMNSVSLVAERVSAELSRGEPYANARNIAFSASLIPITNSLLAVGLVSLPGMMTGQILSGVSPLIAARYQIMVMCMIYGSSGIASALFLVFAKQQLIKGASQVADNNDK